MVLLVRRRFGTRAVTLTPVADCSTTLAATLLPKVVRFDSTNFHGFLQWRPAGKVSSLISAVSAANILKWTRRVGQGWRFGKEKLTLAKHSNIKIERHTKAKGEASPLALETGSIGANEEEPTPEPLKL